ncbi:MAG: TonB-dependent receptor [Burkholderiaceae bacterium]
MNERIAGPLVAAGSVVFVLAAASSVQAGDLDEVVITATRHETPALDVPASASVVDAAEIARRGPTRFGDALADVPSAYVRGSAIGTAFPSSGTSVLSLRGVPRTVRALVLVDGMPVNNALSGGINVSGIPLDDVLRVETVRGPYSALYGGNAMGGVVNFITAGADQPLAEVRLGAGTQGYRSMNAVLRRRLDSGLGIAMSWGYRHSDGYDDADWAVKTATPGAGTPGLTGALPTLQRDGTPAWVVGYRGARPWSQTQAGIKLDAPMGTRTRVQTGVAIAGYRVGYERPQSFLRDASGATVLAGRVDVGGGQRITVSESDFSTATPATERDVRWWARIDHDLGEGRRLDLRASMLDHEFSFPLGDRAASGYDWGSGQWYDQPNQRYDLDASLRLPIGSRWLLTVGGALSRGQLYRSTYDTTYWRDEASATGLAARSQGVIDGMAAFAQAEWFVDDRTTVYLGGRADRYATWGRVEQSGATGFVTDYARREFGAFSPKLAVSHRVSEKLSLRASFGTGFRAPALLDLYSRTVAPSTLAGGISVNEASPDLGPERIRAIEVGADGRSGTMMRWSATLFRQTLKDLIYRRRLSPTLTRTQNAGEAVIEGVEASMRLRPFPAGERLAPITVFVSAAHLFKYEITRNDAVPASVGKRLTDVAQTVASVGVEYERGAFSGSIAYRYRSAVFGSGDDLNTNTTQGVYGAYDAHGTVDARVAWRFADRFRLALGVQNLTDRRYFEFYRQPGRTVTAELAIAF